jgi:hypothetical protein
MFLGQISAFSQSAFENSASLLPMHQLITLTAFFRQHSLTCRGVCGDTRRAAIKRITLRPGGCAMAAPTTL